MAVAPAVYRLDLEKVRAHLGSGYVRLADESAMSMLCPDCEVGAMPPFGNLYDLPVFVDPTLAADEFITFNAGTHEQAVRMRYADYERLVQPVLMDMIDPVLV
jgi:Ala-tRNA(Pro) deacylase